MFNRKTKFISLLLASGTLLSSGSVFAQQASSESSELSAQTYATPLYTSGIYTKENLSESVHITHDIHPDYDNSILYDSYLIQNDSENDISFDILIPQITTLLIEPEALYDFSALLYDTDDISGLSSIELLSGTQKASFEISQYYSPIFSSTGLSEKSLTLQELYNGQTYNTDIPDDEGVLYHLTCGKDSNESLACLSISNLSDNCHIYPLGCSYTTTDDGYELSINEGFDSCYVFLTGNENDDFSISLIEDSGFSVKKETSDLKEYLKFSCDWYLNENEGKTQATKELLLSNLADYFGRSSVTVSLDLLPTINWLTMQKRFFVNQYTVSVPANSSVFAWINRSYSLSKKEVVLNAQLSQDSLSYAATNDTITVSMPDGYSTMVVRNADNSKLSDVKTDDLRTLTYSLKEYKGDTYSVALYKTPMWNATLKYLPVFIVIMAVFMLLCFISYLSGRKKR